MIPRFLVPLLLTSVFLAVAGAERCRAVPLQSDFSRDFRQLFGKYADLPSDPCLSPGGEPVGVEFERSLFGRAADMVTQELNAVNHAPAPPKDRAVEVLRKLEHLSAEVNAAWPDENRFHFYVYDFASVWVVKMTFRTKATSFAFGVPERSSGKPNRQWRQIGLSEGAFDDDSFRSWLDIYDLQRGPSGNPRFLSKFEYGGCAGGVGVVYDVREWDSKGAGNLKLILRQPGRFGPGDYAFPVIGELQTKGTLITLPYCWYSPVDTWLNPSMCSADTYDISGDKVSFRARAYNRPDILPIAKAIEYAGKGDYVAVRKYCASDDVAHKLIRDISALAYAVDIQVTRTGDTKEQVELQDSGMFHFEIEKRADRWVIVAFRFE
jgi:hypothetical protein